MPWCGSGPGLGMENDRLRVVTQAVGIISPNSVSTVNTLYANPRKYLNDKLTALQPKTRELVSLALIRLAYLDPEEAAVEIDKLRWKTQLTAEERNWIWGVIGKRAAMKLSGDAPDYFAPAARFRTCMTITWPGRRAQALRAKRWQQVLGAITAMGDSQRNEAVWVYWRARALMQLATEGARAQALTLLQSIAGSKGFYEQLALEELGQRITVPTKPAPLTAEEKEAARLNPGLNRALYAISIGLRPEGVREWNYTTNLHVRGGMDERAACRCGHGLPPRGVGPLHQHQRAHALPGGS
jgi:soluble lytic murein transglycosylase